VEEILTFNKFFSGCEDRDRQSCAMVPRWIFFGDFFASCVLSEPRAAHFRPAF